VEDDPAIRSLLSTMLTQKMSLSPPSLFDDGASLIHARQEGTQAFDVIIMDYRMPLMNGLDAARLVKSTSSTTKIILATSYDVKEEAQRAGLLYLQKPFSIEALRRILEQEALPAS
jgi:two-component system, sensor histidine kinase and response regulator